jgi:hypothetical protein
MAKKKIQQPKKPPDPKTAQVVEQVTARVIFDVSEDIATYYVNHAEVAQSKHEFAIFWGRAPTKVSTQQLTLVKQTGEIHIEPLVQIIVPPTLVQGLIDALGKQKQRYEQAHGKVHDDPVSIGTKAATSNDRKH